MKNIEEFKDQWKESENSEKGIFLFDKKVGTVYLDKQDKNHSLQQ